MVVLKSSTNRQCNYQSFEQRVKPSQSKFAFKYKSNRCKFWPSKNNQVPKVLKHFFQRLRVWSCMKPSQSRTHTESRHFIKCRPPISTPKNVTGQWILKFKYLIWILNCGQYINTQQPSFVQIFEQDITMYPKWRK